jgi:hypothetical protein
VRRVLNAFIIAVLPLTLVAVGLHQIYLASTSGLSPWKGGGFGMFSSPDRPSYRAVRGHLHTDIGLIPVDMYSLRDETTGSQTKAFVNARALPDERRVERWLDVIKSVEWDVREDVAVFADWNPNVDPVGPEIVVRDGVDELIVDGISIEVWGVTYDSDTKSIEPRLVAEHEFEVRP